MRVVIKGDLPSSRHVLRRSDSLKRKRKILPSVRIAYDILTGFVKRKALEKMD